MCSEFQVELYMANIAIIQRVVYLGRGEMSEFPHAQACGFGTHAEIHQNSAFYAFFNAECV